MFYTDNNDFATDFSPAKQTACPFATKLSNLVGSTTTMWREVINRLLIRGIIYKAPLIRLSNSSENREQKQSFLRLCRDAALNGVCS